MLATIILDPPVLYALGGAFAALDRAGGRRARRVAGAYALWFALVVAPFFWIARDWMVSYLFDGRHVAPALLAVGFAAVLVAAALFGVSSARTLAGARRPARGFWIAALGLALWAVATAITWNGYRHVGTLAEFHAGIARPVAADAHFSRAMGIAGPLLALPILLCALVLRRRPKGRVAR